MKDTITPPIQNSSKILLLPNCMGLNLESLVIDSWQLDESKKQIPLNEVTFLNGQTRETDNNGKNDGQIIRA
jgi:hypothetical protein